LLRIQDASLSCCCLLKTRVSTNVLYWLFLSSDTVVPEFFGNFINMNRFSELEFPSILDSCLFFGGLVDDLKIAMQRCCNFEL